jgi:hypothetical protein
MDWPINNGEDAFPVFETAEFTAEGRKGAFQKTRKCPARDGLLLLHIFKDSASQR